MAAKRDYYEVLSVERTATIEIIKKSYKKSAAKFHPDRNPGNNEAAEQFKECAEAYEVLSDPDKRSRYDRFGHDGVKGQASSYADPSDLFGEIFGSFFGGGQQRGGRQRVKRGANLQTSVRVTLAEAAVGVERVVEVDRPRVCDSCEGTGAEPGHDPVRCDYCGGSGQVVQAQGFFRVQSTCPACRGEGQLVKHACPDCRGSGRQADVVELEVKVPAGIDDGMQLCLRGEGAPSDNGGPAGDLFVEVAVEPHPLFERQDSHLIVELPISYTQAALGASVEVPRLDGQTMIIDIPAGTQPGETIRRRGEGLPDPRDPKNGPRGHLHIEIKVEVPTELDDDHERLLRELAELEQSQVTAERRSFLDTIRGLFTGGEDD